MPGSVNVTVVVPATGAPSGARAGREAERADRFVELARVVPVGDLRVPPRSARPGRRRAPRRSPRATRRAAPWAACRTGRPGRAARVAGRPARASTTGAGPVPGPVPAPVPGPTPAARSATGPGHHPPRSRPRRRRRCDGRVAAASWVSTGSDRESAAGRPESASATGGDDRLGFERGRRHRHAASPRHGRRATEAG